MVLTFRIHPDLKPQNKAFNPYLKTALNQLANQNPIIQKYQCGLIEYQLIGKKVISKPLVPYAIQLNPHLQKQCLNVLNTHQTIFKTITEFCQAVLKTYLLETNYTNYFTNLPNQNYQNAYYEIYYYVDDSHTYHLFIPGTPYINHLIFEPPSIDWLIQQCRILTYKKLQTGIINQDFDYLFKNHHIHHYRFKLPHIKKATE